MYRILKEQEVLTLRYKTLVYKVSIICNCSEPSKISKIGIKCVAFWRLALNSYDYLMIFLKSTFKSSTEASFGLPGAQASAKAESARN